MPEAVQIGPGVLFATYVRAATESKENFRARCHRIEASRDDMAYVAHTFISHLVMAGLDLRIAMALAGHKTMTMTIRYSHLAPEHTMATIERLMSPKALTPVTLKVTPRKPGRST